MGLLDMLQSDDPAVKQGLIQFGLGLLSSKGNFGNALGTAGQQGLAGALGYRDRQAQQKRAALQDQLTQGQIAQQGQQQKSFEQQQAEWARQQELRNLPGQFVTQGMKPDTMDNRDVGMPGEQAIPTGFDQTGYLNALKGKDFNAWLATAGQLQKEQPKPEVKGFAPGNVVGSVVDGRFVPQYTVPEQPKPEAQPEIARLIAARDALPPGHPNRKVYDAAIQKVSTHAPAASITNYGSPVPYDMGDGKIGYVQPGNRAGAPPIVMADPKTGIPFAKPPEVKTPPVEFTKSVAGLKELDNGLTSYEKTLKGEGGVAPLSIGEKRAKLQASYTSLQMGLKNAFELGALAGPDLSLLQGMLIDPTSPRAAIVGDKGVAAQIAQARQYLKNRGQAVYGAHNKPVPLEYGSGQDMSGMPDMSSIDAEIARRAKGGR